MFSSLFFFIDTCIFAHINHFANVITCKRLCTSFKRGLNQINQDIQVIFLIGYGKKKDEIMDTGKASGQQIISSKKYEKDDWRDIDSRYEENLCIHYFFSQPKRKKITGTYFVLLSNTSVIAEAGKKFTFILLKSDQKPFFGIIVNLVTFTVLSFKCRF